MGIKTHPVLLLIALCFTSMSFDSICRQTTTIHIILIPRKKRNADAPSHAAAPSWHRTPLMPMRGLQHYHAQTGSMQFSTITAGCFADCASICRSGTAEASCNSACFLRHSSPMPEAWTRAVPFPERAAMSPRAGLFCFSIFDFS